MSTFESRALPALNKKLLTGECSRIERVLEISSYEAKLHLFQRNLHALLNGETLNNFGLARSINSMCIFEKEVTAAKVNDLLVQGGFMTITRSNTNVRLQHPTKLTTSHLLGAASFFSSSKYMNWAPCMVQVLIDIIKENEADMEEA